MRTFMLMSLAIISVALAGCRDDVDERVLLTCASRTDRSYGPALTELVYSAIDKITQLGEPELSQIVPITVASVTESQRLDKSSTFGNVVADFARSRLAQNHMAVSEQRLRSSMLLKADQGEMMLGREPRNLVAPPLYSTVLTGTYGVGGENVFVSLKLIRADNGQILSAADFIVWRTSDIDAMLGVSRVTATADPRALSD